MRAHILISTMLGISLASSASAEAQEAPGAGAAPARLAPIPAVQADEHSSSINFSILGLLTDNWELTYEHLFRGGHGVIAELEYWKSGDDTSEQTSFGGAVGYRWHWRGQQDSGFLGLTLSQYLGTGSVTITNTMSPSQVYTADINSTSLTANIGKRWMLAGDRFNITLRAGLGWANYRVSTDSMDPQAQEATEQLQELLALLPIGFEGELSIGYNF